MGTETLNQLEDELERLVCSYDLQCRDGKLHNVLSLCSRQGLMLEILALSTSFH